MVSVMSGSHCDTFTAVYAIRSVMLHIRGKFVGQRNCRSIMAVSQRGKLPQEDLLSDLSYPMYCPDILQNF